MNISRLIQLATQNVDLIAGHEAEDVAIRNAALDQLLEHVGKVRGQMADQLKQRTEAALAPPSADALNPPKKLKH